MFIFKYYISRFLKKITSGSDYAGRKQVYHIFCPSILVSKTYIFFMLKILKVKTHLSTCLQLSKLASRSLFDSALKTVPLLLQAVLCLIETLKNCQSLLDSVLKTAPCFCWLASDWLEYKKLPPAFASWPLIDCNIKNGPAVDAFLYKICSFTFGCQFLLNSALKTAPLPLLASLFVLQF